jgi:CDP-diglyceride synthetase
MAQLRDYLSIPTLSPQWNNIGCVLLTVLAVKGALELASSLGKQGKRKESRILIHVVLSSTIVLWPLYDTSDWSWRLNVLVPAALAARLIYKGLLQKDPDDEEVQMMSRSSSPSELLLGPFQLCLVLIWLGFTQFMGEEAALILAAIGIGDGVSPWIGVHYGRHVHRMPFSMPKTMEGSVCGVFLGTIAGSYAYMYMLGMPLLPLRIVLAVSAIAAVVEGTAPANMDNLILPLVMHLSVDRVKAWLPA